MRDDLTGDDREVGDRTIRSLIIGSAEVAGGAVGGALGFFAAGPISAAALGMGGAVAARTLSHIGGEIADRVLGRRERVRIGGVLALSAAKIKQRTDAGEQLRDDGFFGEKECGRSEAEEVAENILLKAQREAEEKKLPYMANLLTNLAFDDGISAQFAHQIVKTVEGLSYRQLCLLLLFSGLPHAPLRSEAYRGAESIQPALMQILYECYDLYAKGLVGNGSEVALGLTDLTPSQMRVHGLGGVIFNLLGLGEIPIAELTPLIAELSKP
jgi:hypothetical protein